MNRRTSLLKEAGLYCAALAFGGLMYWGYKERGEGVKKFEYEKTAIAPLARKLKAVDKALNAYISAQDGVINAGDPLYKALNDAYANAEQALENAKKNTPVERYDDLPVLAVLAGGLGAVVTARKGLRERRERKGLSKELPAFCF